MANFLKIFSTVAVGVALGLFATWAAIERGYGFGAIKAGPWTAWPRIGSAEADPYARAIVARSAAIPLGLAEGLLFVASADDSGAPLDPKCEYQVRGKTPPARFWTLTVASPHGFLVRNELGRYGFTSSEIIRAEPELIDIIAAREARSGNWLPIGGSEHFVFTLRLYDTIVRASSTAIDTASMPSILRGRCQ